MVRARVIVSGVVQGVFFRESCRRQAVEHRVGGWVRNLPDGSVEVVLEGAADAVEAMIDWTRHGPPRASVARVAVYDELPEGLDGFAVLA